MLPRTDPAQAPAPLLQTSVDSEPSEALPDVQVLEGMEYLYEIDTEVSGEIVVEPRELFAPDDSSGRRGRLRPGLATGRVHLECRVGAATLGRGAVEVRSRKLDYLLHYRWMLRDIADAVSELVMERFAPSEQRFQPAGLGDARTLYQRFEFLRTLISGNEFEEALQHILARPYILWEEYEEFRRPDEGVPARSQVVKELVRPGARVPAPFGLRVSTLPVRLGVQRTDPTVDNPPNRFVKFALVTWRDAVESIRVALAQEADSLPVDRGLREVELLLARLDGTLAHPVFRDVGALEHFPAGNQVLQKREGYREVLRTYIQFELASKLAWEGGEDVYWAGQRNLAALYEYWTFFQVAAVLSELGGNRLDLTPLIETSNRGLGLSLVRGEAKSVRADIPRLGRALHVHLWFNRTFGQGSYQSGSWTRPMRPDVSLFIDVPEEPQFHPVWVHFDAKYKVESLQQIMGSSTGDLRDDETEQTRPEVRGTATRDDLLKMHAYRDAIRRSAGAYVLYPGETEEVLRTYHELLPGLGAFVLRPTEQGPAEGTAPLRRFLDDVLTHVASQVSEHERERFWTGLIHRHPGEEETRSAEAASFLTKPPADTEVLLAYVRGRGHLDWIHTTGLYNLRADGRTGSVGLRSRELGSEYVVLYGPGIDQPEVWRISGAPQLLTREAMIERGYPNPRGQLYLCLRIAENVSVLSDYYLTREQVERAVEKLGAGMRRGSPIPTTWLELVLEQKTPTDGKSG